MNKKAEKKSYVAPQMTVLQMKTTCQLLQGSYFYQNKDSGTGEPQYHIVDFD